MHGSHAHIVSRPGAERKPLWAMRTADESGPRSVDLDLLVTHLTLHVARMVDDLRG